MSDGAVAAAPREDDDRSDAGGASGSDAEGADAREGRGKMMQRHKRELKELHKQQEDEGRKLTSFAKAKRENRKIAVRAEKRDFEDKFRILEQELLERHAQELAAVGGEAEGDAAPTAEEVLAQAGEQGLAQTGAEAEASLTRKSKQQLKREKIAEIERSLREESL